ncbi:MAG: 4-(cytidine 5'-diphospho)-2-C-methyl-D-erythritol kinase [Ignavibacteria bacterium]|nr:4-(cytidine 5'-diphospho)-2-C-methyl-D-erythritol kinase [Ignavibacteria bacterium]
MEELKVKAPAKVNLGLHVISKRDDGYHNIETIFYPIKLYDVLTFNKSKSFRFTSDNEEMNKSSDNLIIKAKDLLEEETKQKISVHIHLKKNIPIGGGLGGGSSDAAAALKSLNNFMNLNLDDIQLKSLALRLGSDVPFFLDPKPCFASSRGEKLEQKDLKINYSILVINPVIHISTKWAYSNIIPKAPVFNLEYLTQKHLDAPDKLSGTIKNDFEDIVFEKYPEIKKLKGELNESSALFVLMSGSGSSLFAIYKDNLSAEQIMNKLKTKYFTFLQKN